MATSIIKTLLNSNVAKWLIETYSGSSLAGSNQSVKSALDSLNSKSLKLHTVRAGADSWGAGTIGRYITQKNYAIPDGYTIVSMMIFNLSGGSNSALLLPFTSADRKTAFVNVFAGTASAVTDYQFSVQLLLQAE